MLGLYADPGARLAAIKELRCVAGAHGELVSAATTARAAVTLHSSCGQDRSPLLSFHLNSAMFLSSLFIAEVILLFSLRQKNLCSLPLCISNQLCEQLGNYN